MLELGIAPGLGTQNELPQPGSIREAAALKGLGKTSGKSGEAHFMSTMSSHATMTIMRASTMYAQPS